MSGLLPLPEPLVRHHLEALAPALREWAASSRIPPVLLLTGPAGVGKREIGHFLAQWVLCERRAEALPCGECGACRRALAGSWVDFTEVLPEEDSDTLKVDQFRSLKATAGFSGGFGASAHRVILIANAERMTPQAANSLLKLLEEPPRGWVFLLTVSDPTLLLPTIISRCQRLRLRPLAEATIRELLAAAGFGAASGPAHLVERAAECARLAQGSWARAQALTDDAVWERRQSLFRFLEQPGGELNALVDWAAAEPKDFGLMLDLLEGMALELVRWSMQSEAEPAVAPPRELALHARAVTRSRGVGGARAFWLERAARAAQARRELVAPLNKKLLAQDVLMPWLGAAGAS